MVIQTPLNIDTLNTELYRTCNELCSYTFDYKTSSTIASVRNGYLQLGYTQSQDATILFNNISMQIREIRLYGYARNQYNSQVQNYMELYIHHIDTENKGINFMVCVPIMVQDNAPQSNAQNFLTQILPHLTNTSDELTAINQVFSLNDFVPYASYFTADTTLPYEPNNGEYRTIFFIPEMHVPIISSELAEQIRTLINAQQIVDVQADYYSPDTTEIMYNKGGSTNPVEAGTGDDIWIDCQPTGESLIPQNELEEDMGITPDIPFTEKVKKWFENDTFATISYIVLFLIGVMIITALIIKISPIVMRSFEQLGKQTRKPPVRGVEMTTISS